MEADFTPLAVLQAMPCLLGPFLTVSRDRTLWEGQCLQVSKAQDVRVSEHRKALGTHGLCLQHQL